MRTFERHGQRTRSLLAALAVLLVVLGVTAVVHGLRVPRHPPQPTAAAARPLPPSQTVPAGSWAPDSASATAAAQAGTSAHQPAPSRSAPAAASPPTQLTIPSIGVDTPLAQLGLKADRSVEVPPLRKGSPAGWYRYSPVPGQPGPAVILGHVDSAKYGPAVFFKLGALRPGDRLSVTHADGTVATFSVDRVVSYPKDHFPTLEVYGNTPGSSLRLITCGGRFDFTAHSYTSNIVAYASLIGTRP